MHRKVNMSPMLGIILPHLLPFEINALLSLQFQWIKRLMSGYRHGTYVAVYEHVKPASMMKGERHGG